MPAGLPRCGTGSPTRPDPPNRSRKDASMLPTTRCDRSSSPHRGTPPPAAPARAGDPAGPSGHSPPEVGAAPGWPVVLYFHHVRPDLRHYTSVTPSAFDRALAQVGE